jgi:DNA repair protein RadC
MQQKTASFPIKNWSEDDKPREKMLNKGPSSLSDAELVALLIGSGNTEESAVTLSKRILASVKHELGDLGRLTVPQLMKFKGIGKAKAVTIAAALELGRRRRSEGAGKISRISSSREAFDLMQPLIGELPHEEFWIVYLNNANRILHTVLLSKGGITGTLVDVRLVMKQALELGAVALILAHNHPSGILKPSEADRQLTSKLKHAASALDIKILDHLIITAKDYYSFADQNIL